MHIYGNQLMSFPVSITVSAEIKGLEEKAEIMIVVFSEKPSCFIFLIPFWTLRLVQKKCQTQMENHKLRGPFVHSFT